MIGTANANPDTKNLKRFTKENAAELGRKGGKNSWKKRNEAKKDRMLFRELLPILLDTPLRGEEKAELKDLGIANQQLTQKMLLLVGLVRSAGHGNVAAFDRLVAMLGEDVGQSHSDGILADLASYLEGMTGGNAEQ